MRLHSKFKYGGLFHGGRVWDAVQGSCGCTARGRNQGRCSRSPVLETLLQGLTLGASRSGRLVQGLDGTQMVHGSLRIFGVFFVFFPRVGFGPRAIQNARGCGPRAIQKARGFGCGVGSRRGSWWGRYGVLTTTAFKYV